MNRIIDLRSDTVTKPTPAMREAMVRAEVGDDVYAEDPTVNALQEHVAAMLGKESALFVPSGVMANQIAIKCHTQSGDEIIAEAGAHVFNYETGGAAFLSNVQVMTLPGVRGMITCDQIIPAIRPDVYYSQRTSLICLENTHNRAGGCIYPLEEMQKISTFARERGIRMHLDGARLWNASVASGISLVTYAREFDTVSVCFSKGLGAPVGSILAGPRDTIARARIFRKIFGGGMRQAGILAAGARYAVDHHIDRLKEDHANAKTFALRLKNLPGISLDIDAVQTNIVILDVAETGKSPDAIIAASKKEGVYISGMSFTTIRAVTHMDVSTMEVEHAAEVVARVIGS